MSRNNNNDNNINNTNPTQSTKTQSTPSTTPTTTSISTSVNETKHKKPTFIEKQFLNYGLNSYHVPAGLLFFNGMLWVEWLGILVLSVRYQPLRRLMRTQPRMVRFHHNLQQYRLFTTVENFVTKSADRMSTNRTFLKLGRYLNSTPDNLTYGAIETFVIYNTGLIIFAPINFVTSVVILRKYFGTKPTNNDDSNNNNNNSNNSNNNGNDTGNTNANDNSNRNENNSNETNTTNNKFTGININNENNSEMNMNTNTFESRQLTIGFPNILEKMVESTENMNNYNRMTNNTQNTGKIDVMINLSNNFRTNNSIGSKYINTNPRNINNRNINNRNNSNNNDNNNINNGIINYNNTKNTIKTFLAITGKNTNSKNSTNYNISNNTNNGINNTFVKRYNNVNKNNTTTNSNNNNRMIFDIISKEEEPYTIASMLLTPLSKIRNFDKINSINKKTINNINNLNSSVKKSCINIADNLFKYCKTNLLFNGKQSPSSLSSSPTSTYKHYINKISHYTTRSKQQTTIKYTHPRKLLSMSTFERFKFEYFR